MLASFLIILIICIPIAGGLSQSAPPIKIKFNRIEVKNGLSHSNVTAICQDSKGFLWIGTENGLNKYDGYEFKVYQKKENDSLSLLVNAINFIFEDSDKTLWVATRTAGLHYYDATRDVFVRVPEFLAGYDITHISEDDQKNVLVIGKRLNYTFVGKKNNHGKWEEIKLLETPYIPVAIIHDTGSMYWIGIQNLGLQKWDLSTTRRIKGYINDPAKPSSLVSNEVITMTKTKKGDLWIGTRNGLSKYNAATDNFLNFSAGKDRSKNLPIKVIRTLCEDNNVLWIGTENGGVSRLDLKTLRFQNYVYNKDDPYSLSDNSIWALHRDREGRLWIGTFSRGLCVLDNMKEKFHELNIPLENNIVNAIHKDKKGRLWIGTEGGLVKLEETSAKIYKNNPDVAGTLSSDPVLSIFEDSRNRIWVGTWAGGVNLYDERNDRFITYTKRPDKPNSLSDPNVYDLTEDKETGNLIVSSYHGVNVMVDEKSGTFKTFVDPVIDSYNYVRALFEDSKGRLWVGSIGGLSLLDITNGNRKDFDISSTLSSGDSTSDRTVNFISEDFRGRICIGARNGFHIQTGENTFSSFSQNDGLPSNDILGFLQDKNGYFWLSSVKGISKLDEKTRAVVNFDVNDGLVSDELKHKSVFNDNNETFFFGGTGISVFNPDSIFYNPHKPIVYFTDLKIQNESVQVGDKFGILKQPIIDTREISIPPAYNFFTVHFSSVSFTSSKKNQYAYKLEGFNKDWTYSGNARSVSFTNLDPGRYRLLVKASNNDGLWSDENASLAIHILPPWWETYWFRVALILVVAFAITTTFRYRIRQVKLQNLRLENLVRIRTNELEVHKVEIENQNKLLQEKQEELAAQNEELVHNQEEISAQRDMLFKQNDELIHARGIIENQNREIMLKNENLEVEVEKRTSELVEYNQQLEQFAFISAHNLRSPVARILGLGNLFEIIESTEEKQEVLKKILETTRDLDSVVHDLNKILDIRRDNTSFITQINLTEEIESVKHTLASEVEQTHAQINYDFTCVNSITTIKSYLDSILFNLISNSIKYRHPERNPVIDIRSDRSNGEVLLTFRDNGLGIDLSLYGNKIFSLYNRFHSHVEGKGLGLYLVKTQLASIGGKIKVESELEKGTTFLISIKQ